MANHVGFKHRDNFPQETHNFPSGRVPKPLGRRVEGRSKKAWAGIDVNT